MCPHCHKNAPIIYRGLVPTCTACGAVRAPFTGSSVNLTGKPAKVGGTVASAAGVLVLVLGLTLSLLLGLVPTALGHPALGLALGIPVGLLTLAISLGLFFGGKTLRKSGTEAESRTREQAIFALASHRGGLLRAGDVSKALNIPLEEADAELTALAKQKGDQVSLELDEDGGIYYRFLNEPGAPAWPGPRVRVEPGAVAPSGTRAGAGAAAAVADDRAAQEELAELEASLPPLHGSAARR